MNPHGRLVRVDGIRHQREAVALVDTIEELLSIGEHGAMHGRPEASRAARGENGGLGQVHPDCRPTSGVAGVGREIGVR